MKINQNLPHYVGGIHPNCDYHHGQISPAIGVKCFQVARANRENPALDDGTGHTYKHAPDLAFFGGRFYIQYLTNPEDEHTGAGISVLASSADGETWEDFVISFPEYRIRKCSITDYKGNTHEFDGNSYAFMHQRMCFYKATNGKMLLLGFYGWSPKPYMTNWDNYGVGRVVRELYEDGTLGEIYFIRYNQQAGWSVTDLNYPQFTNSNELDFVAACNELLSNRLYVQQWAEENGDIDELIQIKHDKSTGKNEAFCWYHIDEKTIIALWKHSKVARSDDNGITWSAIEKSHSLVMSGQKVWGEKTHDGKFAMVYDPTLETQHRYPLCVTTSLDGLAFSNMLLVHGEVPPMKYKGFWKDVGAQYMRGIVEGIDKPDCNLWITYSVNKEDIWIAKIPVPVSGEEKCDISENFNASKTVDNWNLYCPKWAKAECVPTNNGTVLRLNNAEPYDYCKAERVFKEAAKCKLQFQVTTHQCDAGALYIEICNPQAQIAARLIFQQDGKLYLRTVCDIAVMDYEQNTIYDIALEVDCQTFTYQMSINGVQIGTNLPLISNKFMMAVNSVSCLIFRTGSIRNTPTLEDNPDNLPLIPLENCHKKASKTQYDIHGLSVVFVE